MIQVQRYFVKAENWSDHEVILKEDAHHIMRVMRFEVGDTIICVHPNGQAARCEIIDLNESEQHVVANVVEWIVTDSELPVHVTIVQSLPKGNKLDFIIQKGTELGASKFILYESERSVVKWNPKKRENRLQRFQKIAQEASEQSGRNIVPDVIFTEDINKELQSESFKSAAKLLAYEEEAKGAKYTSLYQKLTHVPNEGQLVICIGPEGGFSAKEVASFKTSGFTPVRLGKRILRTETAALYALASISYHFEEMQ